LQAFEASARLGSFSRAAEELSLTHSAEYAGRIRHHLEQIEKDTFGLVSLSVRTLPFQFADLPFDGAIYHSDHVWRGTQGVLLFPEGALVPVCAPALMQRFKGKAMPDLSLLTHLHLTSRPDAWRQWYGANAYKYGPQAAGGPRYELFTMMLAAVQAGLGVGLMPHFWPSPSWTTAH
jgi:LysR family transcriptional regulator, glycine cleavage system transcriptional activator